MLDKKCLDKCKKDFINDKANIVRKRTLNKVAMIDLVTDADTVKETNFNINIKTHGVTDQQKSGRCWAFSVANVLREEVMKKCNLEEFELSLSYIAFYEKIEKYNLLLERLIQSKKDNKDLYDREVSNYLLEGVCDGGYFTWFANIVDKYGIVPKSVYPETYSSTNTVEMNDILSRLVRKFYLELEKSDNYDELKEKYIELGYKVVTSLYGVPVDKFDFEYTDKDDNYHIDRDITPKEFYKKYIGFDLLNDFVEIETYNDEKYKYNNLYQIEDNTNISGYEPVVFMNLSPKEIKDLTIKQLKSDELVVFYSYVPDKSISGIWTDVMGRYGDIFDIDLSLDINSITRTNSKKWGHAMVISGVKTIDDKPIKWKIENSWGERNDNKGDYIADDDWFDRYVFGIIVNKKHLSADQKKILDKKPVVVSKWDFKLE